MSIRIICPSCRKHYNLAETMQGKTVACRECRSPINVPFLARKGRGGKPAGKTMSGSRHPLGRRARRGEPTAIKTSNLDAGRPNANPAVRMGIRRVAKTCCRSFSVSVRRPWYLSASSSEALSLPSSV